MRKQIILFCSDVVVLSVLLCVCFISLPLHFEFYFRIIYISFLLSQYPKIYLICDYIDINI